MLCYGLAMPLAGYLVGSSAPGCVLLLGTAHRRRRHRLDGERAHPGRLPAVASACCCRSGSAFTSPVALTPVISRWFTRQRGMALFFLSTGSMAGMAVMTPVLTLAIETLRLAATLLGFAAVFVPRHACRSRLFVIRDERAAAHRPAAGPDRRAYARRRRRRRQPGLRVARRVRTAPFWKMFARPVRLRLQHEPARHARHADADGPRLRRDDQLARHRH